jgi:agmatinase
MDALFGWTRDRGDTNAGRLCVLGAPHDGGNAIRRGASRGPGAIRRASLTRPPPRVAGQDLGNLGDAGTRDLAAFLSCLAGATARARAQGLCPLVIGGDHAISFAVVSTLLAAGDICVVWFDAHTDFSPWSGGAAHDPKQVLRRIAGLEGVRRVVQIGYRGITTGDERNLGDKAVVVTSAEARTLDAAALLDLVPHHLPCYLSIDIDVIDPLWAQGTAAPVPDGLPPSRVRDMLCEIVRHRRVIGVDLVEVNPALDPDGETSAVAAGLLHAIADDWGFQLAMHPAGGEPPG